MGRLVKVSKDFCVRLMFYFSCILSVFDDFYILCKEILKEDFLFNIECLLMYCEYCVLILE